MLMQVFYCALRIVFNLYSVYKNKHVNVKTPPYVEKKCNTFSENDTATVSSGEDVTVLVFLDIYRG